MNRLKRFMKDESGATAIEYGLIAAGIAVAIAAIVFTIGEELLGAFQDIETELKGAGSGGGGTGTDG